jgi:hypothetical protein
VLGFPITVAPIGNAGLLQPVTDYPQNIWLSDEGTGTQSWGRTSTFTLKLGPWRYQPEGIVFSMRRALKCDLRTLRHRTPQTASVVSRSFEAQLRGLRLRDCITERTASRRDQRATRGNVRAQALQPGSMREIRAIAATYVGLPRRLIADPLTANRRCPSDLTRVGHF